MNTDEFDSTMEDIRGAFRLLYLYTRRILDLMQYISTRLDISYNGGYAKYSASSPVNGKGNLSNWAWDWLNMYFYEFHFSDIGSYKFSILLQSDTGYWDANVDKLDIDHYAPINNSKTRLIFILGLNGCWDFDRFCQDSKELKSTGLSEFRPDSDNGSKGEMLYKIFDIKDFKNKETTDKSLDEYIQYLEREGINDIALRKLD